MALYVYETIPAHPDAKPVRFELKQSMNDRPLTTHPETGEPVRRIITGGFGFIDRGYDRNPPPRSAPTCCAVDGGDCPPAAGGHCCGPGCGCA